MHPNTMHPIAIAQAMADRIRQFMTIIGPISSIYDFLTFGLLLWVFEASARPSLFRTGWYVESLATQTLVVFVIRTAGNPFKSRPSWPLLIAVLTVVTVATGLPYIPLRDPLGFTPLPLALLGTIALLTVTDLALVGEDLAPSAACAALKQKVEPVVEKLEDALSRVLWNSAQSSGDRSLR